MRAEGTRTRSTCTPQSEHPSRTENFCNLSANGRGAPSVPYYKRLTIPLSFHNGKVLSYLDKAIMATRLIPSLSASYSSFALSFDRLVLYLRALGVSSTVLWSLTSSHAPSKPCASALARILNCLAVLWSVHQRVLVGPFQEYMNTLADFKNRLLQDYNPWDQITLVQSAIFRFRTLARSSNISAKMSDVNAEDSSEEATNMNDEEEYSDECCRDMVSSRYPRVFAAIYFVDSRFITRNIEMITYSLSNVLDNQSQET
ncbi:hypothetical protein EMCRGX_G030351 [Ephydatia muelleri]